jgi:hypothetical protein
MALGWLSLPCAPKPAIGNGKRTLGRPASLPRRRGRSKAVGLVADTLDVAGLGFGHGL